MTPLLDAGAFFMSAHVRSAHVGSGWVDLAAHWLFEASHTSGVALFEKTLGLAYLGLTWALRPEQTL